MTKNRLAIETQREPRDPLSRDAAIATAAGMSYGKYKGQQYELILKGEIPPPPEIRRTMPAPEYNITCAFCGVSFKSTAKKRKYCSEYCYGAANRARQKTKKEENNVII